MRSFPLVVQAAPCLNAAEKDHRQRKRHEVIQKTEHQESSEQLFPILAAEPNEDGCIEHTQSRGRVTGKAEQRGYDEDREQAKRLNIESRRHQHIHRERGRGEIEKPDHDLQQHQGT